MVVVSTSGYFVTVVGPYLADQKNNDASILNHMLKTNVENIKTWVNEEDVFIVDRGFRDSLALLEELGIRAEMPAFMNKGDKQMSTENANASRLVTKVSTSRLFHNINVRNCQGPEHLQSVYDLILLMTYFKGYVDNSDLG